MSAVALSRGPGSWAHLGITQARALYSPINDRRSCTLLRREQGGTFVTASFEGTAGPDPSKDCSAS